MAATASLQAMLMAVCTLRSSSIFIAAWFVGIAILQTQQIVNECIDVAMTSGAMDGAAQELNPGWVHRRENSSTGAGYATSL